MTGNERELLRLQVLFSIWPTPAGRKEFKTQLHLMRALEEVYDKVFAEHTVEDLRDIAQVLLPSQKPEG